MDELRLFVALELPDIAVRALENVQERLRQIDVEQIIRWSSGDGFHLTLKFLGETPEDDLPAICEALLNGVKHSQLAPFNLTINGLGAFPDVFTPRTVWAGVTGELEELHALRKAVESAISPLGFPTEAKAFSPHLTLGRAYQNSAKAKLGAFGRRLAALDIGSMAVWPITAVSLMHSDLRPGGAVYTELARCELSPAV